MSDYEDYDDYDYDYVPDLDHQYSQKYSKENDLKGNGSEEHKFEGKAHVDGHRAIAYMKLTKNPLSFI